METRKKTTVWGWKGAKGEEKKKKKAIYIKIDNRLKKKVTVQNFREIERGREKKKK